VSAPRLWPVVAVLSVLIWIIATTDGRHVFVKEALSEAFDSQAENFLRGNVDVAGEAIRWEGMVIKGHARMYFGAFPAFLRMPLNAVYPAGRGGWSRISGFLAGEIALLAFAGLLADALKVSALSGRGRTWLGSACLVGFVFGTPLLLLLGSLSIYNEAIIWGFAWSMAALVFAWRSRKAEGRALNLYLLAFSICSGTSLLSRITYGAPTVAIGGLLAFLLIREKKLRFLPALLVPLSIFIGFHLWLSYARFGNFTGISFEHYTNPTHREFLRTHSIFSLWRVPNSLIDYFSVQPPIFMNRAPFIWGGRHASNYPELYSITASENYLPVTWAATWLLIGAISGALILFRRNRTDLFERGSAIAFACESIGILSFFSLSQRYSMDLYPFLIFCFLIFLRYSTKLLPRICPALIAMVALSITINSLATLSWLLDGEQNIQPETHAILNKIVGRPN
jgi:hypothetical protein